MRQVAEPSGRRRRRSSASPNPCQAKRAQAHRISAAAGAGHGEPVSTSRPPAPALNGGGGRGKQPSGSVESSRSRGRGRRRLVDSGDGEGRMDRGETSRQARTPDVGVTGRAAVASRVSDAGSRADAAEPGLGGGSAGPDGSAGGDGGSDPGSSASADSLQGPQSEAPAEAPAEAPEDEFDLPKAMAYIYGDIDEYVKRTIWVVKYCPEYPFASVNGVLERLPDLVQPVFKPYERIGDARVGPEGSYLIRQICKRILDSFDEPTPRAEPLLPEDLCNDREFNGEKYRINMEAVERHVRRRLAQLGIDPLMEDGGAVGQAPALQQGEGGFAALAAVGAQMRGILRPPARHRLPDSRPPRSVRLAVDAAAPTLEINGRFRAGTPLPWADSDSDSDDGSSADAAGPEPGSGGVPGHQVRPPAAATAMSQARAEEGAETLDPGVNGAGGGSAGGGAAGAQRAGDRPAAAHGSGRERGVLLGREHGGDRGGEPDEQDGGASGVQGSAAPLLVETRAGDKRGRVPDHDFAVEPSGGGHGEGCKRHRGGNGAVGGTELDIGAASGERKGGAEDYSAAGSGPDGLQQQADRAPTSALGAAAVVDIGSGASASAPGLGGGSAAAVGGDCVRGGEFVRVEAPKVPFTSRVSGEASPDREKVGKRARDEPLEDPARPETRRRRLSPDR